MADFDPWDVIVVPFPYTNRPIMQRRPALVLAAIAGAGPALLWVLMVTSAENRGWPGDVAVSDLAAAGLPAASIVRTAKLATVEAEVATRIGTLPHRDRAAVAHYLRTALAPVLVASEHLP